MRYFQEICPFRTKPWGLNQEISRYQGQTPLFAVFMEFCSFRRFSLSTNCRGLMQPQRLGTKGADFLEIPRTKLPLFVNHFFLVQEQNYKLALSKMT